MQETSEIKRFAAKTRNIITASNQFIRVDARSSPIMEFIGAVAVALILWFGGRDVILGKWTTGSFVAFLTRILALSAYQEFRATNSLFNRQLPFRAHFRPSGRKTDNCRPAGAVSRKISPKKFCSIMWHLITLRRIQFKEYKSCH